jgi:DNA-binding beta-propeller fold protein YncE
MASGSVSPFNPEATVSIAATTTSATAAIPGTGPTLLVFNSTAATAFLRLGTGTLTARVTDFPVPSGAQMLLSVSPTVTAAAVILSSGSGTVYVSRGTGSAL